MPIPTPANALIAIPANSIYVMPSKPNPRVIINNIEMTNAEPRIADNGSKYGVKRKSGKNSALITIEKAAPSAAPAETPINPGSASGFLKRPCKHAPDIDKAAPTTAAKRTLGKRILTNTSCSKIVRLPVKYFKTEK